MGQKKAPPAERELTQTAKTYSTSIIGDEKGNVNEW